MSPQLRIFFDAFPNSYCGSGVMLMLWQFKHCQNDAHQQSLVIALQNEPP